MFEIIREAALDDDERWDEPEYVAEAEAEWNGFLAGLSPEERFEREFGMPADADALASAGVESGDSATEAAVQAQEELVQLDRVLRIAEAGRIRALVRAYEAALLDLGARFGTDHATRSGRGAATFFASAALQLGGSPRQIAHLVDTAMAARDRLPRTWTVFLSGAATWRSLDTAVRQADGLDEDRWPAYDEVAARAVTTSNRLQDLLRRTRERLQDDTADARARTTFERRAVYLDHGPDGRATWSMDGPAADLIAWDAALTKAAIASKVGGDERTVTQLRYDIARDLIVEGLQRHADPTASGMTVPKRKGVQVRVVLTVPALAWLGHSSEQARLAGYGPIAMETAKRLAEGATSMLRVLTDPITGVRVAMDRAVYRAPADLRRWLQMRDEWCRFPGCRRPASSCDVDHLHEWQDGGVTDVDNLLSECRPHHAAKTIDLFQAELDAGGWARWTDPWGNRFADPPTDPMDPAPHHLLPPDPDEPAPF